MRNIDKQIGALPLTQGEELHVNFEEFKGRSYLHIRRWFDDHGQMRPGRAGIALKPEQIPWVRAQIEAAETAAAQAGLLEAEHYECAGVDPPTPLLTA